jgi:type 1 glutamine amidotransferase
MRRALIVYGGWEGHEPAGMSNFLAEQLGSRGVETTITDSLDVFKKLRSDEFQLIVPMWTMESIEKEQLEPLLNLVRQGVGIGGLHGVIDSFRHEAEFHLMFGGQWVTHFEFAVRTYEVHMDGEHSPITDGLPAFSVTTEQYYLLVDPANSVLATMRVDGVRMPVAWTKRYGKGRVFYCSLGHSVDTISQPPAALELVTRGMLWAAGALEP